MVKSALRQAGGGASKKETLSELMAEWVSKGTVSSRFGRAADFGQVYNFCFCACSCMYVCVCIYLYL